MKPLPAGFRRCLLSLMSAIRMFSICMFSICLIAALPPSAHAGQTIVGSGRIDCGEYLNADEAIKLSIENWVLGFLSFTNLRSFNLDLLQNLDNGTLIDAVESYCREYPSARISEVSAVLLKNLVASVDADCSDLRSLPSGQLSLCRIPGASGGNGASVEMIVPAVE